MLRPIKVGRTRLQPAPAPRAAITSVAPGISPLTLLVQVPPVRRLLHLPRPKAPTTGAGTGSNFVAKHGTCRVPLYRYPENKTVCNATVYYCCVGRRLEAKAS